MCVLVYLLQRGDPRPDARLFYQWPFYLFNGSSIYGSSIYSSSNSAVLSLLQLVPATLVTCNASGSNIINFIFLYFAKVLHIYVQHSCTLCAHTTIAAHNTQQQQHINAQPAGST
jgi:hypothetical protein